MAVREEDTGSDLLLLLLSSYVRTRLKTRDCGQGCVASLLFLVAHPVLLWPCAYLQLHGAACGGGGGISGKVTTSVEEEEEEEEDFRSLRAEIEVQGHETTKEEQKPRDVLIKTPLGRRRRRLDDQLSRLEHRGG